MMSEQNTDIHVGNKPFINRSSIKWIIGLTLFWPAIQLIIFFARFGDIPGNMLLESLYFAPMGFVSALLLVNFQNRSGSNGHYWSTTAGYILLAPIAFVASLMSGLILSPLVGPLLFGIIPLAVGVAVGFLVGRRFFSA